MRHTLDARPEAAARRLRALALLLGMLAVLAAVVTPIAAAIPKAAKADHHPTHGARHHGDAYHAYGHHGDKPTGDRPKGDHRDQHQYPPGHQGDCGGYDCAPPCDDSGHGTPPGSGYGSGYDSGYGSAYGTGGHQCPPPDTPCPDDQPRDDAGKCPPAGPPPTPCPDDQPRDDYGNCSSPPPAGPPPTPCPDDQPRDDQGNCTPAPPPCTVDCTPAPSTCTANCAPAPPSVASPPAPSTTVVRSPAASVRASRTQSASARLRTPSRCASRTFRVTVSGRSIRRVTFWVGGRRVRTVAVAAGRRSITVSLPVRRFGARRQPVQARVTFGSGARARTLTASATRCAEGAVSPQFTG